MSVIQCKMCGGGVELSEDKTYGVCEYCGSTMTLPKISDEQRAAAFNRGNHFRRIGEFDDALEVYERIVREDENDAEAHWCCALCRFGIEYVEDPSSYEYIPTCHRASFDNFLEDVDYLAAVEHSDGITRRQYQKDGAKIAEVQRGILATSQNEKPYDVFICYKETDANGDRTRDSAMAQDIYYQLTEQGRRVFFARITLEDKAGAEYEPYIFAALHSAKVMIVVGTCAENLNAVWVKNEWSRFLAMMKHDRNKVILPCYRDMDPYDLPEQLSVLQSYDMSKIGFIQDLSRGIAKVLDADKQPEAVNQTVKETVVVQQSVGGNADALLKRGFMALTDREWKKADDFFEEVLNQNAECGDAYLGKALAGERCYDLEDLSAVRVVDSEDVSYDTLKLQEEREHIEGMAERLNIPGYLEKADIVALYDFDPQYTSYVRGRKDQLKEEKAYWRKNRNMSRALQYQDEEKRSQTKASLESIYRGMEERIQAAIEEENANRASKESEYQEFLHSADGKAEALHQEAVEKRTGDYQACCMVLAESEDISRLEKTEKQLQALGDYQDSRENTRKCEEKIQQIQRCLAAENKKKKKDMIIAVSSVAAVLVLILVTVKVIIPFVQYHKAEQLFLDGKYLEAESGFQNLRGYKNAPERVLEVRYHRAQSLLNEGDFENAKAEFEALGDYQNSEEMIAEVEEAERAVELLQQYEEAKKLEKNGETVKAAIAFGKLGNFKDSYERSAALWRKISNSENCISAGIYHTVGLCTDGRVLAVGDNEFGKCDVEDWDNVISVHAGKNHTVGLLSDGTVIAVGDNTYGQCNVEDWDGISFISTGKNHTVGLRSDGTVIATGQNDKGQCDVETWENIVFVSAGYSHTVGIRSDGTVVAAGDKYSNRCDVTNWKNIVSVSAGYDYTAGLCADGTVVVAGDPGNEKYAVKSWKNIIAVVAGTHHTVGLQQDGTVVAAGSNEYGRCDVDSWHDIVAISTNLWHTVGLRNDGTVVAAGWNEHGQCDVSEWTDIRLPEKVR